MRLPLVFAALLLVSPAMAYGPNKAYPCWVRVHKGAQAYAPDDSNEMKPVSSLGPTKTIDKNGGPILFVDTKTSGGPWIWRLREYAYRRSDVDLFGDCTRVRVE